MIHCATVTLRIYWYCRLHGFLLTSARLQSLGMMMQMSSFSRVASNASRRSSISRVASAASQRRPVGKPDVIIYLTFRLAHSEEDANTQVCAQCLLWFWSVKLSVWLLQRRMRKLSSQSLLSIYTHVQTASNCVLMWLMLDGRREQFRRHVVVGQNFKEV